MTLQHPGHHLGQIVPAVLSLYRHVDVEAAPRRIRQGLGGEVGAQETRSQLVRIPAAVGEYRRAELRSPDPAANPYLAFALMIQEIGVIP